ncbi:phosphoglycolate phosphatase [Aureimonas sp. Leaf454]|uniref:phosphoglycolate phosphatase n=1 Tax=Aureimonas sp. Leaf454 TaxID=1736381 RepID=UPI0006FAAE94|nr:phosphoglycolate phosphatase [Aureimonas sp. Leaf454]KQT54970.1 phosphoglycolate phosphatase [Aureimonas sp. Leaf454]
MTRPAWPRAILFDLDGTLIDSAPDIHESLNQTMESLGHPPFTLEAVIGMIGRGVPKLIERAHEALLIDLDAPTRDRIVDRFLKIYNPRATELTTLNAGASDTTRHFHEIGLPIGVVTNKPDAETREILQHFGVLDLMAVVVGGDAGPAKKPAPDLLFLACETLSIQPSEALFVGDSENDVEAAKAAGMRVVAVRGGYTRIGTDALGADLVIDRLDALADALGSLAPETGA